MKKKISTPIMAYGIAVFISIVSYTISLFTVVDEWYTALLQNIGFGIFASTVVALLIDYGNTAVAYENEKRIFDRLIVELKEECSNLPSELYTSVYESRGYDDNHPRTYSEWNDNLFADPFSEKEILFYLQQVSTIKNIALQLKETLKYYLMNENVSDCFIKELKYLISICRRIERNANEKKYGNVKNVLENELRNCIIQLFPELEIDFSRSYNEETYIE